MAACESESLMFPAYLKMRKQRSSQIPFMIKEDVKDVAIKQHSSLSPWQYQDQPSTLKYYPHRHYLNQLSKNVPSSTQISPYITDTSLGSKSLNSMDSQIQNMSGNVTPQITADTSKLLNNQISQQYYSIQESELINNSTMMLGTEIIRTSNSDRSPSPSYWEHMMSKYLGRDITSLPQPEKQ